MMRIIFPHPEKAATPTRISMEKLHSCKIPITPFLVISILFSSLVFLSSGYTPPNKYFINCGSESTANEPGRSFVADTSFLVDYSSKAVKSSNQSAGTSLYQTARVFHKPSSSYQFDIDTQGSYIIRLHFFAFSSPDSNLASALFNVTASDFPLLSNFSVLRSNSPTIKEFLLTVDVGKLIIHFIPFNKSSLAFVNAIEVFLTPENFIPDNTTHVTNAGIKGNYSGLLSQGLHTIYRINVGGQKLTQTNDTLWRDWIPDDDFLSYPENAKDYGPFGGTLTWDDQYSTKYVAPEHVYETAKKLTNSSFANITWGLKVSKNSTHLVRVHFCDIISSTRILEFNFSIYSNFSQKISSFSVTGNILIPFYFDFVVDSDNSGFMNISVHKRDDSDPKNAMLNGLEIMEMVEKFHEPIKKKNRKTVMVGSVGAVLFLVASMVGLLLVILRKRAKARRNSKMPFSVPLFGGSSYNWLTKRSASISLAPDLKLALKIPYSEIQRATKNFNTKLLIGEGGFGKVYRGTLGEGVKVAVKRSEPGHGQGILEFQTEITVLSQIRHRHLVSLIGYCDERDEMILVYEFMEKGTLKEHLYILGEISKKSTPRSELSWVQRLKICIDAAEGLHYLHTGLSERIIHRDVKSTNILLNEDYIAKVADFGLSKSGASDTDENTGVKGSFGYLDPEYVMSVQLTEKSDVYSFGVVLLEVLCARPVIILSDRVEEVSLAEWGMLCQKKGQLEKIIDPSLVGTINSSSLRIFGQTAEKCLRPNSTDRPMMHDVLGDLKYALKLQQASMERELDEDSMNVASLDLAFHVANDLPSQRVPGEEDDSFLGVENDSTFTMASGVFSQLKIGCGR